MTSTASTSSTSGQSRWQRMVPPTLVAGALATATLALHVRDPHEQGSWGLCPSAALGFWCPGCGGLRAVNDLGNARLLDAASSNLLLVASLPVVAWVFLRWTHGRWTGRPWSPSDRALSVSAVVLVVAMAAFMLVRNLPGGAWLAP